MRKREYIDDSTKKLIERMQDLKIEQDKADIKEMAKESETTLNLAVEQTALAQDMEDAVAKKHRKLAINIIRVLLIFGLCVLCLVARFFM